MEDTLLNLGRGTAISTETWSLFFFSYTLTHPFSDQPELTPTFNGYACLSTNTLSYYVYYYVWECDYYHNPSLTDVNQHVQCATNFTSENIPNGIGFGGKINHLGLFISASFDQGHTFSCTTFGSPSLSKTSRIQPEVIECWGIVQASNELDSQQNAIKGTVLDRFKEDRNMLQLLGMASSSNEWNQLNKVFWFWDSLVR